MFLDITTIVLPLCDGITINLFDINSFFNLLKRSGNFTFHQV
jgi:hypothetical protein